jgi:hypothetical protein
MKPRGCAYRVGTSSLAGHTRQSRYTTVRMDPSDRAVVCVGDVEIAHAIGHHALRKVETGDAGHAIGAANLGWRTRYRGHSLRGQVNLPDGAGYTVGDIEIPGAITREGRRIEEAGAHTVRNVTDPRHTGDGDHHRHRVNLSNYEVLRVGDVEIARSIGHHASWKVETSIRSQTICTADLASQTCPGRHFAGRRHNFSDCAVERIGHVNIAGAICRNTLGKIELCSRSYAIGTTCDARGTCKSSHLACCNNHCPNRGVKCISYIKISGAVGGYATREAKPRISAGTVRTAGYARRTS